MNPKVDIYLEEGCGRCSKFRTPQCKVHTWAKELELLRSIANDCGLQEDFKWSQPCYTFQNKNIFLVTALKNYAALAFIKGALLTDSNNLLVAGGEKSLSMRQFRFTNIQEIVKQEAIIKAYIFEAIEVERAALKVNFTKASIDLPIELQHKFMEIPELKTAFESLTPGRQRGYIIIFSQPKQSKTRVARIEKYQIKILSGKGLND